MMPLHVAVTAPPALIVVGFWLKAKLLAAAGRGLLVVMVGAVTVKGALVAKRV